MPRPVQQRGLPAALRAQGSADLLWLALLSARPDGTFQGAAPRARQRAAARRARAEATGAVRAAGQGAATATPHGGHLGARCYEEGNTGPHIRCAAVRG